MNFLYAKNLFCAGTFMSFYKKLNVIYKNKNSIVSAYFRWMHKNIELENYKTDNCFDK